MNQRRRNIQRYLQLGFILCSFLGAVWLTGRAENPGAAVTISEICSNNFSAVQDANGEYADYIELYNPGEEEIGLEGYFLSDDEENLKKHALAGTSIPAKGYLAVWLSGEGKNSFGISKDGESIYLSSVQKGILEKVEVPQLGYNSSYGKNRGGYHRFCVETDDMYTRRKQ